MTSISVVMPSLNSAAYIGRAIDSVMSQGYEPLELVIQDGGSTDGTIELVRSLGDGRISLASEPDRGQADALNKAVGRASGEWILWLNSDDELAAGALARVAPALRGAAGVVYGDTGLIDVDSNVVKRYRTPVLSFDRAIRRGAYIFSGSMLVRRGVLHDVGGFDESLSYCMDFDLLCRLAQDVESEYVPGPVGYLRTHAEAKSRRNPWGFWAEQLKVARRYGASAPLLVATQLKGALYLLTKPLWRTALWRRLRPEKEL